MVIPAATRSPVTGDILLEGESVLWTGQPRQSWLVREDLLYLPLCIAFFVGGVFVFGFVRVGSEPQVVAVLGGVAALAAAVGMTDRLWFAPRRRRQTRYAITNLRARIESARYLVSYALREGLEVNRIAHRDGTVSLRPGTFSGQRELVISEVPAALRTFEHLADATCVHQLIRQQVSRNSGREIQLAMLPLIKAVPTPLWQSALTDVG